MVYGALNPEVIGWKFAITGTTTSMSVLDDLTQVLAERKTQDPTTSYVASLHKKGLNKILEKIGEESTEVILAAKDAEIDANLRSDVVKETADLWFHTMVMLSTFGLSSQDVLDELGNRFGIGGHEEKANR